MKAHATNLLLLAILFFTQAQPCLSQETARSHFLQERIDLAKPGDTIRVEHGIYTGNITLGKKITLIGLTLPVLRGSGTGSVITVTADSCTIQGFVVEHSGKMLVDEDAGILLKSSGNVVRDNDLRDVLFGIYLLRSNDNTIEQNRIQGRKELELGERGSGVHLWDSHSNRLIGNVISFERDGFYIQNANRTWIEGNEVFALRYGLHYMYADSNTFLRNNFHDNVAGAAVMYSRGIVMRHNVFSRNRGFASYGVLFQDCHGMSADSNIMADNVVGMFFEASTDNLFTRNVIARNDVALEMFSNSISNTFTENDFVENLSPLTVIGKKTGSNWSSAGRGNYWTSYSGYDLDNDGVGDVPFKIQNVFSYLEGRQPNVRLYLYSPASQALAVAAEAFPIVDVSLENDGKPLMKPIMSGRRAFGSGAVSHEPNYLTHRSAVWIGIPIAAVVGLGLLVTRLLRRRTA